MLQNSEVSFRKSTLAEMLWPDFDEERAYSQLYTAIYHIRKTLNPFHDHFSIKNLQESYVLYTNNVFIDVVEWEHKVKSVPPLNSETIARYEKIMELYTGPYLEEYDHIWKEAEQYRLEELWVRTAHRIAKFF